MSTQASLRDEHIEFSARSVMKNSYYKYRPLYRLGFNGKKEPDRFTQSIFEKAELWYSAPKVFNDPFDCNLQVHVHDSTDAEWEAYCDEMMKVYPSSRAKLIIVKKGKLWKKTCDLVADIGEEQQRIHYNESSVFCLSRKGNSIPMFSYYADSHRGIAIEFSFSDQEVPCGFQILPTVAGGKLYDGCVVLRDVDYSATFPELNYHRIRDTDKIVRHLLFTKSSEWSHEKEFRIFRRKVPQGAVSFDRKLLTRVIFGCKTTDDDVALVKSWLTGWPSNVVLSKAETDSDKFELLVNNFELFKGP